MLKIFKLTVIIVALIFTTMVNSDAYAESFSKTKVYKYVDAQGRAHFTDQPRHDGYVQLIKTWKGWKEPKATHNYKESVRKFEPIVVATSKKYRVPTWLVSAVIHAESFYNPYAVSSAGAVGLMQLMPGTAKRYGVNDRQNPRQNIEGGVRYLRDLLDMFQGDVTLALAAYNAGEGAVKKYGYRIPPYKETQHYVRKVNDLSRRYKTSSI